MVSASKLVELFGHFQANRLFQFERQGVGDGAVGSGFLELSDANAGLRVDGSADVPGICLSLHGILSSLELCSS